MKRIANLDDYMQLIAEDDDKNTHPPTRREILRMIGNIKAETADDSRRVRRIITQLRDKTVDTLTLENEDINFVEKAFEKNAMNLTGWMQGQILEIIADAEKVEPAKPQVV